MNTTKIFFTACAALILSAALLFIVTVFPGFSGNAAETSGSVSFESSEAVYTVKADGDKIGIYAYGSDTPLKTISVDPSSLPRDAQLILEKGITVSGHEELLLLIEDYIG